jgi:mRNA-degrading endonuclease RelE of RelBE toxin-antitoxin system
MIEPYEVFLRAEAIESLRSVPVKARKRISMFIDSLSADPSSAGDYSLKDPSGRIIEIKIVGSHAITFWADHAVREIKIIDIRNADHA